MNLEFHPAASVGSTDVLRDLAVQIFGSGDRPPDWFDRKLHRECVDLERSVVACAGPGPTNGLADLYGYFLLGFPRSLVGIARAAGGGVRPDVRGRGIGRQLVEHACNVGARGCRAMQVIAEPPVVDYYKGLSFKPYANHVTLLQFATGRAPASMPTFSPWDPAGVRAFEIAGWLREAWDRSGSTRTTFVGQVRSGARMWLHLSREGVAYLGHRVLAESSPPAEEDRQHGVVAFMRDALDRLPEGAPVLIVGADPASPAARGLVDAGWRVVQRGTTLRRVLHNAAADAELV